MDPQSAQRRDDGWTFTGVLNVITCIVALVLAACGFLLQVAGIGALHNDCDSTFLRKCEDLYREHWWATAFQATIVLLTLASVVGDIVKEVFGALGVFLAIATTQLITSAEDFISKRNLAEGSPNETDVDTAAAGYVIAAAGNFLLILVIGISARPRPTMPKMGRGGELGMTQKPIVAEQQMAQQETSVEQRKQAVPLV